MNSLQRMLGLLTSNYSKEGNNKKLIEINSDEFDSILEDIEEIGSQISVDDATGDILKKLGENLLVFKRGDSEEDYRRRIKLKIRAIRSRGRIGDIIPGLDSIIDEGEYNIVELWDKSTAFHPAGGEAAAILVSVNKVTTPRPFPRTFPDTFATVINDDVTVENVNRLAAPGVRVYLLERFKIEEGITIGESIMKIVITPEIFQVNYPRRFGSTQSEVI